METEAVEVVVVVADMVADEEVEDTVVADMVDSRVVMEVAVMEVANREDMAAGAGMEAANRGDMGGVDMEEASNRVVMEVVADMEDINSLHTQITCKVYIKSIWKFSGVAILCYGFFLYYLYIRLYLDGSLS